MWPIVPMLQCGFVRANLAFPIAAASYSVETISSKSWHFKPPALQNAGAGDGNRTHVASLEGWSSTIELRPPVIRSARQANRVSHAGSKAPSVPRDRMALVEGVGFEPT